MIKNLEPLIVNLLEHHKELRDNDYRLVANVYFKYLENIKHRFGDAEYQGVIQFLSMFAGGDFPNPGTITRCRRKIQELEPELRGKMYDRRHQQQTKVKKEMINWEQTAFLKNNEIL